MLFLPGRYVNLFNSMKVTGVIFFSFLFGILSFSFPYSALAQTDTAPVAAEEVTYEKVNPDGGFAYLQKRFSEKAKLFFLSFSTERSEDYYRQLANRRLAEVKYIIDQNKMAYFEKATVRYSTAVGNWVEYINKKGLSREKEPAVQLLSQHVPVVQKLMEKYDPTTAEWRFVKHDLDYLNIYISQLK
ncbi:MAG: hypothetical protein HYU80_02215 [Candidatus Blackburnbacteria bacterium]|nr:hypothetical protein [Candidatus Blackburnbacteria bacterium]